MHLPARPIAPPPMRTLYTQTEILRLEGGGFEVVFGVRDPIRQWRILAVPSSGAGLAVELHGLETSRVAPARGLAPTLELVLGEMVAAWSVPATTPPGDLWMEGLRRLRLTGRL